MSHSWSEIHFGSLTLFIWVGDFILYALYMLDRVESLEFQMLSWFIMLTIGMFVIAIFAVPAPVKWSYSAQDRDDIITFSFIGFTVSLAFFILLEAVADLVFRFEVLGADTAELLLGLTAAINEEVFRWSALRVYGHFKPHEYIPAFQGMGGGTIITALLVNTFWTFFHAKSYVTAPSLVWVSLWLSGMIITVCLYFSQHLIVAITIHALWNLAVTLNLATILLGGFGL